MEWNWSTFVLEIINFVVLVWLLKRFLYKPVLDVIARRRAGIEKSLADAQATKAEAKSLQDRYEGRLADWEAEQRTAREQLNQDLQAERARKLGELQAELDAERTRAEAAEQRRLADFRQQAELSALEHGTAFAGRLLGLAATADLQARLFDAAISEMSALSGEQATGLVDSAIGVNEPVRVSSAFPLADEQRDRLRKTLAKSLQVDSPIEFTEDPELQAGLRVTLGATVLGLNLADELEGFARLSGGEARD